MADGVESRPNIHRLNIIRRASLWATLLTAALSVLGALAAELELSQFLQALIQDWQRVTRFLWAWIIPIDLSPLFADALTFLALCLGMILSTVGTRLIVSQAPLGARSAFRTHAAIFFGVYFFTSAFFAQIIGSPVVVASQLLHAGVIDSAGALPVVLQVLPGIVALLITVDGIYDRSPDLRAAGLSGLLFGLPMLFLEQAEHGPLGWLFGGILGVAFYVCAWSAMRLNATAFPRLAFVLTSILLLDVIARSLAGPLNPILDELRAVLFPT